MKSRLFYQGSLIFSAASFVLISCAGQPVFRPLDPGDTHAVFEAEYDVVFPALVRTLSALGLEPASKDMDKGFISTQWMTGEIGFSEKARYSCGLGAGGLEAALDLERVRVQAILKKASMSITSVTLLVDVEGRRNTDPDGEWQVLYSCGKLENAVFTGLKRQLRY